MVPRPNTNLARSLARSCTTCTCSTKFLSEHTRCLAQVIESVSGSFLSRNREKGSGEGGTAQMNQVRPSTDAKIVPQIVGNIAYITRHAKHSYGPLCLVCVYGATCLSDEEES